jgi:hypothetical protein
MAEDVLSESLREHLIIFLRFLSLQCRFLLHLQIELQTMDGIMGAYPTVVAR